VNVGGGNRLNMADLRTALAAAGFSQPQTLQAAGNIVAAHSGDATQVVQVVHDMIEEDFGMDVMVAARSEQDLTNTTSGNPFQEEAARDPARLQVAFFPSDVPQELVARLSANTDAFLPEKFAVAASGRELFTWHPEGIARSKLWAIVGKNVQATSRNWNTVLTMLALIRGDEDALKKKKKKAKREEDEED